MKNWKSIAGTATFITLMGSTASFADVSAVEVWADWQGYLTNFGYEVAANETASSDGVTVEGLSIAMDLPEDGGKVKIDLGTLTFKDQGDGTVAVLLPEHMPMGMTVNNDFAATVNYDTKGMSMVVSGSADEMTYDYSADQIAMSVSDLVIEGDKIDDAKIDVVMSNLSGKTNSAMGDLRQMTQNMTADTVSYDVAITEPGGGSSAFSIKGEMANLAINSDTAVPDGLDFEQMAAALTAGFAAKGALTWGASGYEFNFKDGGDAASGSSTADSGSLNFAMNRDSLNYGGSTKGTKASFSSPDLPFPVDITIAESVFNLLMPANKTDTPSDFSMTVKLGDFTISDGIWNMVDPGTLLSRDPATILMDFDGKANWLIDIMDPESAKNSDVEMPGQIHELTLKSLQVKAAGADLTGAGAFTFNNDDLETFDGIPAPTGALDLKLTGGNGLMDNLVKMGLLPEDQAMGARMMMGLFAVVGEGEDTLTSKIEVTGDGQILANGQRLK